MSATVVDRLTELWETPHTSRGWLSTVDHKIIGKRYIFTALIFLLVGGVEAMIMRIQLAGPNQAFLTPEAYHQIFTTHSITMIWWYAQPILSGFSVFLIPLLIGSRDMAFPRANAFTYYSFVISGIFLYISLAWRDAPHAGWFAYTPLTDKMFSSGYGIDFYAMALILLNDLHYRKRDQLHRYDFSPARARDVDEPSAPAGVQHADYVVFRRVRASGAYRGVRISGTPAQMGFSFFRSDVAWESASLAAALLDFRAPLGVHRLPARHGDDFDAVSRILP